MALSASGLIEGPRGRRFILRLAYDHCPPDSSRPTGAEHLDRLTDYLHTVLRSVDVEAISRVGERGVLIALGDSLGFARYWQEPDLDDEVLAGSGVRGVLEDVAAALLEAPGIRAFEADLDARDQVQTVTRFTRDPSFSADAPARATLEGWRAYVLEAEFRARVDRPADVTAPYGGDWWSKPWAGGHPFVDLGRRVLGGVPIRFLLEEDDFGPTRALARRRDIPAGARVLELRGADDWVDLVERWPLEVTASRRHDWWRTTGLAGRWFIPDFAACATDHDAIHLSCAGYLLTAGRALAVRGGHTLLAGWDPDATFWLSDLPAPDPVVERWIQDPHDSWTWHLE